jgi:hypothetical protein
MGLQLSQDKLVFLFKLPGLGLPAQFLMPSRYRQAQFSGQYDTDGMPIDTCDSETICAHR